MPEFAGMDSTVTLADQLGDEGDPAVLINTSPLCNRAPEGIAPTATHFRDPTG